MWNSCETEGKKIWYNNKFIFNSRFKAIWWSCILFRVTGLTEVARQEISSHNVRVLSICPGAVATELLGHTTDKDIINGYEAWKEAVGAINITANDVAKTIKYAYELPQSVSLREIVITDTKQDA